MVGAMWCTTSTCTKCMGEIHLKSLSKVLRASQSDVLLKMDWPFQYYRSHDFINLFPRYFTKMWDSWMEPWQVLFLLIMTDSHPCQIFTYECNTSLWKHYCSIFGQEIQIFVMQIFINESPGDEPKVESSQPLLLRPLAFLWSISDACHEDHQTPTDCSHTHSTCI